MKRIVLLGCVSAIALLSGCSGTETKEEAMADYLASQELKLEREQELNEQRQERAEAFLDDVPEWYLKPPHSDEEGIYSVALGSSMDLSNSIRKAELQGNYKLASKIKNLLSAEETMTGSSDSSYRFIINAFVERVDISNSELVSRKVKVIDGKYHTFVMMKYPFNAMHKDMIKANSIRDRAEIETAYQRLMKRIKDAEQKESVELTSPPSEA